MGKGDEDAKAELLRLIGEMDETAARQLLLAFERRYGLRAGEPASPVSPALHLREGG